MIVNDPYKNDYDHRPSKDKKGRFRDEFFYKGELHKITLPEEEKKKKARTCLITGILQLAAAVLPGLVEHPSSLVLWVTLPYVCIFLPCFYYIFGALEFMSSGMELSRRQYDHSLQRMGNSSLAIAVLAVIAMLAGLIRMIGHFEPSELLYLVAFIPIFPLLLTRPWKKIDQENKKQE
ncbi:MAG: hypothetical protein K6E50_03080 [Lachnospiraceae bacterium]|nr:hypothetical protein [Lachnospiraceae bacterium]